MIRVAALLAALVLVPVAAGCRGTTEIVVRLSTPGAAPASVVLKLHRTVPFTDNPRTTPPFVVALLDGTDLDLLVAPQGSETVLSLLPNPSAGSDLRIAVSAPPWTVAPAGPVDLAFVDGQSQEAVFVLTAPAPDLGTASDLPGGDGAARDGGSRG